MTCCASSTSSCMAFMRKRMSQITLGTVGEFEMLGLTLPGIEGARDPASLVRLPVDTALRLLFPILETLWKLDRKTQARLLKVGLPTLKRYHAGTSLPRRREQLQRIEDLHRCYVALRVLFPRNPELADAWPTRRNRAFKEQSPVAYAVRCGTRNVRRHLEARLVN